MSVVVITPPLPIVTPADIPGDHAFDDALVVALIAAATETIDGPAGWLGRALGPQTIELRTSCFMQSGSVVISLPYPPLIDIVSISYDDASGAPQVVDPAGYGKFDFRAVYPKPGFAWPSVGNGGSVRVRYTAGYDGQEGRGNVPANAKAAIVLMTQTLMASSEANGGLRSFQADGAFTRSFNSPDLVQKARTSAVEALLAPLRVYA